MDNWNEITPPTLMDFTMAREAATAKLAEMSAAWHRRHHRSNPRRQRCERRLDVLTKDREWGARYLSGDLAARTEFRALQEKIAAGDPTIGALTGTAPAGGALDFSSEDQPADKS